MENLVFEDDVEKTVAITRAAFKTGRTRTVEFRSSQLKGLLHLLEENGPELLAAMGRPPLEGIVWEIELIKKNIGQTLKNVSKWSQSEKLHRNWLCFMDDFVIGHVPYGVVLIMSPLTSLELIMPPLCGAIAAGNCVLLKSDVNSKMAAKLVELMPKYLDLECYHLITGDGDCEKLLREKLDHIFYTGSPTIGREIHLMANRNLIPIHFELESKCPVYVDSDVDIEKTVERIMWAKCLNMGQTANAPDYILCSKKMEQIFVQKSLKILNSWHGQDWKLSRDLGRIVNQKNFDRLAAYLTNNGKVAMGGGFDAESLWIQPTILVDVMQTDEIMDGPILGPILPILACDSEIEAISLINFIQKDPVTVYVFTNSEKVWQHFENNCPLSSLIVNDAVLPSALGHLPTGGIGESGSGSYQSKAAFDIFTHTRGTAVRDYSWIGEKVGEFRYPPYKQLNIEFLSFLLHHWKKFNINYFDFIPQFLCLVLGILVASYLI